MITNPDEEQNSRFHVSNHTGAGVNWDGINDLGYSARFFCDFEYNQTDDNVTQASAVNVLMSRVTTTGDIEPSGESHMFSILYDPFRIVAFAND